MWIARSLERLFAHGAGSCGFSSSSSACVTRDSSFGVYGGVAEIERHIAEAPAFAL